MTFFKTVKAISKKHGISQSDFAIALNIPLSTINDWWKGKCVISSLDRAQQIARFLSVKTGSKITIDSLMRGHVPTTQTIDTIQDEASRNWMKFFMVRLRGAR